MKIKQIDFTLTNSPIIGLDVDAIVSSLDEEFRMVQPLALVIKERGGDEIQEEVFRKKTEDSLGVVSTASGRLRARQIIHLIEKADVGFWKKEQQIRDSWRKVLNCAKTLGVKSIAFPALCCDQDIFPLVGCAKIIAQEMIRFSRQKSEVSQLILCIEDKEKSALFQNQIYGYINHVQDDLSLGPYVTVDVLIEMKDGVILIERSNPPYGWALPGGFVDNGESLEEAVIREAKEETQMTLINLRQFHTYSHPERDPRFHTVSTVFIAQGEGAPAFGDDAKGLKVVGYEQLLELEYAFDHKEIIKDYINRKDSLIPG